MEGDIIFYTTGCPKCGILKKKLDLSGVAYSVCDDVEEMQRLGMTEAPALMVGGRLLSFGDAVKWANGQKE